MIPQMEKSEIVKHFIMEGFARKTIYNTLKRLESDEDIKSKKKTHIEKTQIEKTDQSSKRCIGRFANFGRLKVFYIFR